MADDDLLELRVHGVNNTPPASMLYAIQEEYGDSLVGVYAQRPDAGTVRALSWGGLARMSPIPRIPILTWVQSVGTATWIFVLPFGLANVAYWSRRLIMPGKPFKAARTTAALARVFSLGLTLLLASSVCSVSLSMAEMWVQSPSLPGWLSWLRALDVGDRMAIFSLAPRAAMLLLWTVAHRSRVRYDAGSQLPATTPSGPRNVAQRDTWKFGSRDFWDNADLSAHNAAVHTAAGVAISLVWTGQVWFAEQRYAAYAAVVVAVALILGCVALIASMPLVTEGKEIGKRRKALAWTAFGLSVALFAAQTLALAFLLDPTAGWRQLVGMSFIPGALVFILFVLAVAALGWRWEGWRAHAVAAAPIVLGLVALAVHQYHLVSNVRGLDLFLVGGLLALAAVWLWHLYRQRAHHAEDAWGGTAPGILMLLSLFAGVLFSTVFVMAAAALMGDTKAETAPPIYLSFASMLPPVLLVLALLGAVLIVRVFAYCRTPVEPDLDGTTHPNVDEILAQTRQFDIIPPPDLQRRHRRIRQVAAIAHRAEPMVAVLALVTSLAIGGVLILALMLHNRAVQYDARILTVLWQVGVTVAVGIGVFVVGTGAAGGRPLGVVWDLICFLPRAAHPFGPPCYAQRAVPELFYYCQAWLNTPDPKPRKLILSAHSLGGVLAVAIILLLAEMYQARIALITYGCQLRAYFGRIFPELLGPRVLGVTNSTPARLFGCPTFPPSSSHEPDADGYPASVRETLTAGDDVRWINLWRPTDYLGFPVYSREPESPLDRPADEVTAEVSQDGRIPPVKADTPVRFKPNITVRVDTHSDYFRARQYPEAINDLKERLVTAAEVSPSTGRTPRG